MTTEGENGATAATEAPSPRSRRRDVERLGLEVLCESPAAASAGAEAWRCDRAACRYSISGGSRCAVIEAERGPLGEGEIAELLGVSRQLVWRTRAQASEKVRRALERRRVR